MKINDLKNTIHLRALLINYITIQYEENANSITDESLVQEYNYLKKNNNLEVLFISEILNSTSRMEEEFS